MTQSSLRINNNYISLFLCCGTPSHFFKRSSFHSLAQNCWGAPLTCQACFGAAALRCGILRTKMLERHSHNVLNFVSSPFMSFHYERMKHMNTVKSCQIHSNPIKATFATEQGGPFVRVAQKLVVTKSWWLQCFCSSIRLYLYIAFCQRHWPAFGVWPIF